MRRFFKYLYITFIILILLSPLVWVLATNGLLGDIEFGYYRDVNIVKHALKKADCIESLRFGIHEDMTLEDFRAGIHTKSGWNITFAFWEEMDVRQVCEKPNGIVIMTPAGKSQVYRVEYLAQVLKDKNIQLSNIRDIVRYFDVLMQIFEANYGNPNIPLTSDLTEKELDQYLFNTWEFPWNTKSIEKGRDLIAEQMMGRQTHPANQLQNYDFEYMKLDSKGALLEKQKKKTQGYYEKLGENIILELDEIPQGKFMMGVISG